MPRVECSLCRDALYDRCCRFLRLSHDNNNASLTEDLWPEYFLARVDSVGRTRATSLTHVCRPIVVPSGQLFGASALRSGTAWTIRRFFSARTWFMSSVVFGDRFASSSAAATTMGFPSGESPNRRILAFACQNGRIALMAISQV